MEQKNKLIIGGSVIAALALIAFIIILVIVVVFTQRSKKSTTTPGPDQFFNIYHPLSGKCIHPSDGTGQTDTNLVLFYTCGNNDNILYKQLSTGAIQHKASGKCIAIDGFLTNDVSLKLTQDCDNDPALFTFNSDKTVKYGDTEYCIHPNSGEEYNTGSKLVLYNQCANNSRIHFERLIDGVSPSIPPIDNRYFNIYHPYSNKCWHPRDGTGNTNGTDMVFFNACGNNDITLFKQLPNGQIQQKATGRCIHPKDGTGQGQVVLVLHDGCDDRPAIQFDFLQNKTLKNKGGNKYCVHPADGTGNINGTEAILNSNCDPSSDIWRIQYHKMFR
jgi:hypothetical protein